MDTQSGEAYSYRFNWEHEPLQKDIFSIIVLVYNNAHYLPDILRSICEQDYDNLEIIISDDHSKVFDAQTAFDLVRQYNQGQHIELKVIRNAENLGTVKNINGAFAHCSGRYIKAIGADDALNRSDALSKAHSFFNATDYLLFESRVVECDAQLRTQAIIGKRLRTTKKGIYNIKDARRLIYKNWIHATGVFFRREFFDKWGLFDERYRLLEDWPTWLRITRQGEVIPFHDAPLVRYRNDVGVATSINPYYIADRKACYANEIKAYASFYGTVRCAAAAVLCRVYTSVAIRKVYAFLARR